MDFGTISASGAIIDPTVSGAATIGSQIPVDPTIFIQPLLQIDKIVCSLTGIVEVCKYFMS